MGTIASARVQTSLFSFETCKLCTANPLPVRLPAAPFSRESTQPWGGQWMTEGGRDWDQAGMTVLFCEVPPGEVHEPGWAFANSANRL